MSWDSNLCKCICDKNKFFNTKTLKCECTTDLSVKCNKELPLYGWNSTTCSCDFCPSSDYRRTLCENKLNWSWNSSACNCEYCIGKDEDRKRCEDLGSPYKWSEMQCDCIFCLHRDIMRKSCNSTKSSLWDNEKCMCIEEIVVEVSENSSGDEKQPLDSSLVPLSSPINSSSTQNSTSTSQTDSNFIHILTSNDKKVTNGMDFGSVFKTLLESVREMLDDSFNKKYTFEDVVNYLCDNSTDDLDIPN